MAGINYSMSSASVGDITGVTAGYGLSGGGTSGDVTLDSSVTYATIDQLYYNLDPTSSIVYLWDLAGTSQLGVRAPKDGVVYASAVTISTPRTDTLGTWSFRLHKGGTLLPTTVNLSIPIGGKTDWAWVSPETSTLSFTAGEEIGFRFTGSVANTPTSVTAYGTIFMKFDIS